MLPLRLNLSATLQRTANGSNSVFGRSLSKRRAKTHLSAVELAQFRIAEENAMNLLVHLFQADLLVPEHLADENCFVRHLPGLLRILSPPTKKGLPILKLRPQRGILGWETINPNPPLPPSSFDSVAAATESKDLRLFFANHPPLRISGAPGPDSGTWDRTKPSGASF